jgi:subtilisin family serine protease
MASITINGITIDPEAAPARLAGLEFGKPNADTSDFVLVQPSHPLNQAERDQLQAAGAEIRYGVPGGIVSYFPGTDLEALRTLPFVDRVVEYPTQVKLSPSLRGLEPQVGGIPVALAVLSDPDPMDPTPVTIDALLHPGVDPMAELPKVAAAAHLPEAELTVAGDKIRMTCKRRRLNDVAAVDGVRSLQEVVQNKLANNIARQILRAPPLPDNAGHPFDGSGEVVAVADTGFDRGMANAPHPAFEGRVKTLYPIGRVGRTDDPHGHGTHVAGSVLGDGTSAANGGRISGTAPGATLVLQSLLDDANGLRLPLNLNDLFRVPYDADGARIHTNSWGSKGHFGQYDSQSREVDEFVYTHRDMLICFAAGNDGADANGDGRIDGGSVTPPGTAKNCLTVGASENNRPGFSSTYGEGWPSKFPAKPVRDNRVADDPDGMAEFSSRGPTHDNRIKPEVVAPGTFVLSTRSRATLSHGWGLSDDRLYMYDGGTSMATPLVAGCAAALRAFLRTQHKVASPSAALMKEMLINAAHDMSSTIEQNDTGRTPNNSEGFGRINLGAAIGPYEPGETLQFQDEGTQLDTGESELFTFAIPHAGGRIRATLVWTDPPGEGLQNDLDLIVQSNGIERHGNMAAGSRRFDRVNNVEQVIWSNLPQGQVSVTVRAHSITRFKQDYALVVRIT